MLPTERHNLILDLLNTKDIVTTNEIVETFNISIETVRRDLNLLEKNGQIEKVYGGAKLKKAIFSEIDMPIRMVMNLPQKKLLGKKCGELISDGDCIYIDSGSTTLQIVHYLDNVKNLTIVTNSIPVVNELIRSNFHVILIGGYIRKSEKSVVLQNHLFDFTKLNIQKAFICASGVTVKNGISDYNLEEVITRKSILERSKEKYLVIDSSKIGIDVTITLAPLESIDYIITDSLISLENKEMLELSQPELIIVKV